MRLLLDIGGTKSRVAVSKDGASFDEPRIIATPPRFEDGVEALTTAAKELLAGERPSAVVAGIAGPLDGERSKLLRSPNLPAWVEKPLAQELASALGRKVFLENDTALGGLGEARFGAGRGAGIVAYVTVSTGVGGVRIVDGEIDRNRFGFEPGHQVIDIDGSACPSCNAPGVHGDGPGHLEGYVSGTATKRRFGKEPKDIEDPDVWAEIARWLAYGLNNTVVHWSPEVLVLGGPMILKRPGIDIKAVRRELDAILDIFPQKPELREAELGDLGGLYGAMVLAKEAENV